MEIKIGKGAASLLEEKLRSAKKRVVVISPWIGERYAELLGHLSKKIKVILITTERINPGLSVLEKAYLPSYAFVITLLLLVLAVAGFLYRPSLGITLLLLGIVVAYLSRKKKLPKWVKIVENLHAKIYIIDDDVYLSSANLTHTGLKKNIEFIIKLPANNEIENTIQSLFLK